MTPSPVLAPEPDRETFSAPDAMLGWMQEIAPYGVFTTDGTLRIRSWNQWLANHSGLGADKVIGHSLLEIFPEVKARKLDEHFRRALNGEVSVLSTALHKYLLPFPSTARESDVPHMLQTVRIAPLPGTQHRSPGTITIIEDVTQRECQALLLQRQQEHDRLLSTALATLLRSNDPLRDVAALFPNLTLPLGLEVYLNYLYDAGANVLRLNAAGGISPRQKESMALLAVETSICGPCVQSRTASVSNHVQESSDAFTQPMRALGLHAYCCFPLLVEDRLLGILAFASYTHAVIASDEIECLSTVAQYVAIAMDRALREQALGEAQRKLREHADNLETKVAERTARLHETIAQLESFSYTVAHDLRAPIRSLQGYCDVLREDFTLPEDGARILERLRRASNRLDALTRDLLKFSRIARQDVKLEPVDVAQIVEDLLLLTPALQDGVLIVHPPLETVWAQRTLLQQCLSNLFDNAVKFVPKGVRPRIVVRCERRANEMGAAADVSGAPFNSPLHRGAAETSLAPLARNAAAVGAGMPWVRLWVEDNGIGIPREAHEKIFGIFERGNGLDHIEGTGIGLAIVARAVQQMGGRCGVESEAGHGSQFWLELALADTSAPRR